MRAYFIGAYDGCYYVRCMLPLQANGWSGYKRTLHSVRDSQSEMIRNCQMADVIVFQRPMNQTHIDLAKTLKGLGKKIVLDNDDTYIKDSGVPKQMLSIKTDDVEITDKIIDDRVAQVDLNLKEFARIADAVTVTTDFLREEYLPYNKNVIVLPNCVEETDWQEPKRSDSSKVRIGISGSVASSLDYASIIPTLEALKGRDDVQIVLFALPPDNDLYKLQREIYAKEIVFWNQYNVEWHPQVAIADYMDKLAEIELDIMLIPRYDSYFNRCKSNLKFLEASMLEIPVVAQGFADGKSPYQDPEDAKHMKVIVNNEDWLPVVTELVENKKKRRDMGKKARKYVLKRYDINKNAHLWDKAYKSLWNA
jgi:glycosyltransferase involved in cell wall biosynthesis